MTTSTHPSARQTRRAILWVLICGIWLGALSLVPNSSAQDAKKDGGTAAAAPAVKTGERSMLRWAIDASGPIGFFLLGLSIYFTALVIRLFMELRVSEAVPPPLIDKLELAIKDRKFQDAYDVCRDDNSFLAKMVRTGIANLPAGRAEAKEAMNETANEAVVTMESRISYLATIGTLGPMIGLVGTIWGMIESFQTIANADGGQPKPQDVAKGISTALFITLEGVSLSVPAIFFYAMFRNRIAQIALEATKVADRTIGAFYTAAKAAPAPRLRPRPDPLHFPRRLSRVRQRFRRDQGRAQPHAVARRGVPVDHVLHARDQLLQRQQRPASPPARGPLGHVARGQQGRERQHHLQHRRQGQPPLERRVARHRGRHQGDQGPGRGRQAHAERKMKGKKLDVEAEGLPSTIVIRGDRDTQYSQIYRLITACQASGFRKFALKAMNGK